LFRVVTPVIALAFTLVTVFLLVIDLKRPDRFHYILLKPNLKSWLVLGGYILMLYSVLAAVWIFYGRSDGAVPMVLVGASCLLALGAAGYSAFLFAQAKGRDLWQSRLFFWNLVTQATTAGAAVLLLCAISQEVAPALINTLAKLLAVSLGVNAVILLLEVGLRPASEDVRRATELLKKGALKEGFWAGAMGFGGLLPLILLLGSGFRAEADVAYILAAVSSLIGLWIFEDLWIKAGQAVPLS
jgi:formate-dependent nitrite reductase membrane component NrfD